MSEPFIGEIMMFAGNFAPRGWAFCNGQLLSIAQNTALFSILGTTYGGNGQTTFGLPNLQGRIPMHWGQGTGLTTRTLGESLGTESVTLLATQMPAHTHGMKGVNGAANTENPQAAACAIPEPTGTVSTYSTANPDVAMNAGAIGPTGGSQPHDNVQPSLCVSFIIALEGIFPSRS